MALAPDGGVIATGQTNRGFLDWYTVALDTDGRPPLGGGAGWRAEHG